MNVWGLVLSYVLIFLVIGVSTILQKAKVFGDEGARKFIHIGVSNWWILAMIFFTDDNKMWFAMIPPITFILLNYISYRQNLFKAMERGGKGNLGTVYFPISLLILVIFTFGIMHRPDVGAMGILILGYGDGLAAVFGVRYGKHKLSFGKSIEGSLTMFVASLVIGVLVSTLVFPITTALWIGLVIALFATIIELFSPKGFDNLTVPLATSLLYYLLLILI
jgi:phytol kinase